MIYRLAVIVGMLLPFFIVGDMLQSELAMNGWMIAVAAWVGSCAVFVPLCLLCAWLIRLIF